MKKILAAAGLLALMAALWMPVASEPAVAAGSSTESVLLPALMYHALLKDPAREGDYVLSPDVFFSDMIYLASQGYETVTSEMLIAYANGQGTLPEKPVLITLDDGMLNNLTYALPILEALDMHALFSITGVYAEAFTASPDPNPNYAYMSWEEIGQLVASGHAEIAGHSYDMHCLGARIGSGRMNGESAAAYERAFKSDVIRLQEALWTHSGVDTRVYAYPYGNIGEHSAKYLKELGFCMTLTCRETVSRVVRGDPDSLFGLGRFNRPSGIPTEEFMRRILPK